MATDHDDAHRGDAQHAAHAELPSELALRARALQSLLLDKGVIQQADVDRIIEAYESRIGPHLGAQVIARAWMDEAFKQRLLQDATTAVGELGSGGWRHGARLVAVENTDEVHNVVVCTLCSCYPMPLLGPPPVWYKSAPYRARAVMDPRSVLAEFGTTVPDGVEVRVWDSNSEVRYLVLPQRPPGSEQLSEAELASLVGRNAMIGVERAKDPAATAATTA